MKKFMILAAAALTLAACAKQENAPVALENNEPSAISFDGYLNRGVTTKDGYAGLLDATSLQAEGFGVFAYYTDINSYDEQAKPNFMYNQKVEYDTDHWKYTPIKYWPNEFGGNAISDDVDKVSFFAYAPYVEVTPATGKVTHDATCGITGMNRNSANGDPILKYIGSFDPAKSVDLCWGVGARADMQAWTIVNTGTPQWTSGGDPDLEAVKGKPWIDVQRPATVSQKLKFTFAHALTQLNVQIDADVDVTAHNDAEDPGLGTETKIYVRSVTFTGLAMKGALNLNNSIAYKAEWLEYAGINDIESGEEFVIYDGRKDGREGVVGATASNEKSLGLNGSIISDDGNTTSGVTIAPQNLFQSTTATAPIYVIPVDEDIVVTINYDVETEDDNLPTLLSDGKSYGSRINNVIRKSIKFGDATKFENGKSYVIKLHLGMNSVKFDADIQAWVAAGAENNTWLPNNTHE